VNHAFRNQHILIVLQINANYAILLSIFVLNAITQLFVLTVKMEQTQNSMKKVIASAKQATGKMTIKNVRNAQIQLLVASIA
jgi:hypothetical protein